MSASKVIGRLSADAAARTASMRGCMLAPSPCEKLRRKQSAPARISARIVSTSDDAGPSVAMIFVYLRLIMGMERRREAPARCGQTRCEHTAASGVKPSLVWPALVAAGLVGRAGRRRTVPERHHVLRADAVLEQLHLGVVEPGRHVVF